MNKTIPFNNLLYEFDSEYDFQIAKDLKLQSEGDIIKFEELLDYEDIFYTVYRR